MVASSQRKSSKFKGRSFVTGEEELEDNSLLMLFTSFSWKTFCCVKTFTWAILGIVIWIGVKLFCFVIKWSLIGNPLHNGWSLRKGHKTVTPFKSEWWMKPDISETRRPPPTPRLQLLEKQLKAERTWNNWNSHLFPNFVLKIFTLGWTVDKLAYSYLKGV